MKKILKEPLVIFLFLGACIFLFDHLRSKEGSDYLIQLTPGDVQRIQTQWQTQMGRSPTEIELNALIEEYIQEEMYYREAIRMGLDQDDVIIRRRLAQKLMFLAEDVADMGAPGESILQEYFANHRNVYRIPERLSFSHIYLSPQRRKASIVADADALLAQVRKNDDEWRTQGDPFMLNRTYAERTYREIEELFGQDFMENMIKLDGEQWHGPLQSAYGLHLVRIDKRSPASDAEFVNVRERVLRDYQAEHIKQAKLAYDDALKSRYQVERLSN